MTKGISKDDDLTSFGGDISFFLQVKGLIKQVPNLSSSMGSDRIEGRINIMDMTCLLFSMNV